MDVAAAVMMGLTLLLMVSGRTPLYATAIVGSTVAALVAGIPLTGDAETTILSLVSGGLHPVIADMAGVLVFIGAMERAGFLKIIVDSIIRQGNALGRGPGVATAGGVGAGLIGAFTGFTQPAITAVVTGPASVTLGVDPNRSAGTHAHAGHLGNFAGFTHPTLLAVMATAAIQFGWINAIGLGTAMVIFGVSFLRMRASVRASAVADPEQVTRAMAQFDRAEGDPPVWFVLVPFALLVLGFALGYPVFVVGFVVSCLVMAMGRQNAFATEEAMLASVRRIAVPLVATVGFLYMSGVIGAIGLAARMTEWFDPLTATVPIVTMLLVASLAGLLTQSNAASAAIVLPVLGVIMATGDVNPLAAAVAAAGPPSIMQYFLTGGPVAALATTVPVVPGSDLRTANRFQRPSQLAGLLFVAVVAVALGGF